MNKTQSDNRQTNLNWRNFTLGTKLTLAFLAVTLIPLAFIAYINDRNSRQALTNDANEKLLGAAKQTAAILDQFMIENTNTVRTDAQFAAVVDYVTLPVEQRVGSQEEDRLFRFLAGAIRRDPVYISSIAILDQNGKTLADTDPTQLGADRSNRVYYSEVIKTNRPYASTVEYDTNTKKPSIYFAAPIHNPAGEIIGVIRERFHASVLMEYITAERGLVGSGSFPVLVDENNMRIAHATNTSLIYKLVTPLDAAKVKELQDKRLLPPGTPEEISTNRPDFSTGLNNALTQPYFTADLTGDNQLEQVAVASMTTQPWQVAFADPQAEFLAPITAQARTNVFLTLGISVLVGVFGVFISQTLARPIARLTQTAEKIAGGDINVQAKVESGDEIGTLADTFNRMTAQLRDLITSLETRVAARTQDLATVAEVGTATATILDTNKLLQSVVDLTKERFNLYHSHIYLVDETGENLVLASGAGEPGRIMVAEKRSIPVSREQSLVARAARERKGVTVNDVTKAPDFLPNPLLPNTRSELAVPMIVGENLIGVFDIQSDQAGRFTDSDINIQTTLAAQVATSVQNVRAFEQSKAQSDLESLVNTIGQKIQRATSVEDTLQVAARELGLALGASRVIANLQAARQDTGNDSN